MCIKMNKTYRGAWVWKNIQLYAAYQTSLLHAQIGSTLLRKYKAHKQLNHSLKDKAVLSSNRFHCKQASVQS